MARRRTLAIAMGLFLGSALFFAVVPRFETLVETIRIEHLALGLVGLSTLVAIRDRELRRAWVVAFALAAGFGIHLGGIGITGEMPGILFRIGWAGIVGLATASTLGLLGGAVGLSLHRIGPGRNTGQA